MGGGYATKTGCGCATTNGGGHTGTGGRTTTTGGGQIGGGGNTTRGGATIAGRGGNGSPMRMSSDTPARAGAVNAVAIPITASPINTFLFIRADSTEPLRDPSETAH